MREGYFRHSNATLSSDSGASFKMTASLQTCCEFVLRRDVLASSLVEEFVDGHKAIIVIDDGAMRIPVKNARLWTDRFPRFYIPFNEHRKNFETVEHLLEIFGKERLARRDFVIAIGGGACCDVVAFAAAIYRRGIPMIKIPTTLVGLIDAGVATKNAINFRSQKNRLGTFYPPALCILDPGLTLSQPYEEFRCGIAEMLKIAIVRSAELFAELEHSSRRGGNRTDRMEALTADRPVFLSVDGILAELADDLYETGTLCRAADFGHSFSPELEKMFEGNLAHGDAVAFEMHVLSHFAYRRGYISEDYLNRILELYRLLELPTMIDGIDGDILWRGLEDTCLHRGGDLNLPLPFKQPGTHIIVRRLDDISRSDLDQALADALGSTSAHVRLKCA